MIEDNYRKRYSIVGSQGKNFIYDHKDARLLLLKEIVELLNDYDQEKKIT